MYQNNHYAQRALIKSWSELNEQKRHDGFVWHFDFVTQKLERAHVNEVFVREELFTREEEHRFNELVERPLAKFRDRQLRRAEVVSKGGSTQLHVDDRTMRALSLLWAVNVSRFGDAYAKDKGLEDSRLSGALVGRTDEDLDRVADHFRGRFDFACVKIRLLPMYYPEFGSFLLPLLDPEKKRPPAFAMAFPLDPRLALVCVPKAATLDRQPEKWLHAHSVGNGQSRGVLIPAMLMRERGDHAEIVDIVMGLRKGVEQVFAKVREFVAQIGHDTSGLPKGPTWPT